MNGIFTSRTSLLSTIGCESREAFLNCQAGARRCHGHATGRHRLPLPANATGRISVLLVFKPKPQVNPWKSQSPKNMLFVLLYIYLCMYLRIKSSFFQAKRPHSTQCWISKGMFIEHTSMLVVVINGLWSEHSKDMCNSTLHTLMMKVFGERPLILLTSHLMLLLVKRTLPTTSG